MMQKKVWKSYLMKIRFASKIEFTNFDRYDFYLILNECCRYLTKLFFFFLYFYLLWKSAIFVTLL